MAAVRVGDEYQTIEQDWPRLFKEYPEVYDRFAESEWRDPNTFSVIGDVVGLAIGYESAWAESVRVTETSQGQTYGKVPSMCLT